MSYDYDLEESMEIEEVCRENLKDYERVLQEIEQDVGVNENDRLIFEGRAELAEQLLSTIESKETQ